MAQRTANRPPNDPTRARSAEKPQATQYPTPPQPQAAPSYLSILRSSASIPGWAILPLRLFLGISFLSAGFDKLTDPTYLDPSAPSYIGAQITQFAPGTPLEGFLLNVAVPNANLFGVMVMGGEFCIGIAVLLGLLTRFSAAMGLLLNLTFFLSATWNIHPFYFGSDLPYMFGWLTLVLAGPGLFSLDARLKEWLAPAPVTYMSRGRVVTVEDSSVVTRRTFLAAGAAGAAAVVLAAVGVAWGPLNSGKRNPLSSVASPTAQSTGAQQVPAAPTPAPAATVASAEATAAPADTQPPAQAAAAPNSTSQGVVQPTATAPSAVSGLTRLAGPSDVAVNQSLDFTLPSGEPAVLVHDDSGYSAYVAICTHEYCQVNYYPQYKIIGCPCHGSEFDAANGGSVLRGPARRPLSSVALKVGTDGSIYLAA